MDSQQLTSALEHVPKKQALAWFLARLSPDQVSEVINRELPRVDAATIYINLGERIEPGTLDLHGRRT